MPDIPEGTPCWADASFPDLGAAKSFYGELMGWTFDEGAPEFGYYTQAFSDGKKVAGLMPIPPDQEMPTAWGIYFASSDIDATAARIRDHDGQLLMGPDAVADLGKMLIAQDPSGAVFGVWQPGTHKGFEKQGETGSYCWVEITTRDADKADAFFPAVFSFDVQRLEDPAMDYKTWKAGGNTVAGRLKMTKDFPPEVPPHAAIYFAVDNCDDTVATVTKLGGRVNFGPVDTPFGRLAAVADQQGANFSVIDLKTTVGEMPKET